MKNKKNKLLIIILSVVVGLVIVGGATIGSLVIFHKHSYSTEWVYDESCHWHNATCSHKEEISDKGEHEWVKGTEVAPTCTAQGYTNYSCSVCGATKKADYTEISETHHASNSWSNNEENHWHNCTFCDAKIGMDEHTIESTWQIDDTTGTHWQNCSVCGGKQELAEHTLVKDYLVVTSSDDGSISSVTTTERCTLCAKTYTPVTLETSDYVVLTPEDITGNAKTFTDDNKVYILNGTFNNTQFTFDAENVTVVGSGATTAGIKFLYTENADNSVVYGCNVSAVGVDTYAMYGDLSFIHCEMASVRFTAKTKDLSLVVDNCKMEAVNEVYYYAIYVFYGSDENTNGFNLSVTNSELNNYGIYCIFLSGQSASAEAGNIEIANNRFYKWGPVSGGKKRSVLKMHQDKNLSPESYADTFDDTSNLTPEMVKLAKKMVRNNTFDKDGNDVSYFNIDGICFDTVD